MIRFNVQTTKPFDIAVDPSTGDEDVNIDKVFIIILNQNQNH